MNREVSELLEKALSLPPEARAALAGSLLESLDDHVDPAAEEEWNREIAQRIQELDSGRVKSIPWADARRQIAAMLNGRSSAQNSPGGAGRSEIRGGLVFGAK
jgi:putative addiction module component (TIGR02574 family)